MILVVLERSKVYLDDKLLLDWSLLKSDSDQCIDFVCKKNLQVLVEHNLTKWLKRVLLDCQIILLDKFNKYENKPLEFLSLIIVVSWVLERSGIGCDSAGIFACKWLLDEWAQSIWMGDE